MTAQHDRVVASYTAAVSLAAAQARDPGGGLIVMPNAFNVINRELISALAARYDVPAIAAFRSLRTQAA